MLTKSDFILRDDVAKLQASEIKSNKRAELLDGTRYSIDDLDAGSGLLLASGNYANVIPLTSDPKKVDKSFTAIAIATALQIGGKYLSTVTNTHTLANGVTVGDSIIFSWAAGTIGTITGASAIVFTDKEDVLHSDVTWVFDFPIVNVILIWNGSNWEIQ